MPGPDNERTSTSAALLRAGLVLFVLGAGSDVPAQIAFGSSTVINVGAVPSALAGGDLDLDGDADLVIATPSASGAVLAFNSAGAFGATTLLALPPGAQAVQIGEFSPPIGPDLSFGHTLLGGAAVTLRISAGGGAFLPVQTLAANIGVAQLLAADLEPDGDQDLMAVDPLQSRVLFLRQAPPGSFVATDLFLAPIPLASVMASGDLDGDLDPDLVVGEMGATRLHVLRNDSAAGFVPAGNIDLGLVPSAVEIRDLDGGGLPELVVAASAVGSVAIFGIASTPVFAAMLRSSVVIGQGPRALAVADLDGDLDPDVVVARSQGTSVVVLANDGTGTFAVVASPGGVAQPRALLLLDIDADQDLDLVVANGAATTVRIFPNRTPRLSALAPLQPGSVVPLRISSPSDVGRAYLGAFALAASPPIVLPDLRTVPLALDGLFLVSIDPMNPFFTGLAGILDPTGSAAAAVALPAVSGLAGVVLHGAFVVVDPGASLGIGTISPAAPLTIL